MVRPPFCLLSLLVVVGAVAPSLADDVAPPTKPVPLNEKETLLLDKEAGKLLLKTEVCLREGVLEMLCCKKGTKEHESIVAIDATAREVYVGLVAIGAKPGSPVKYEDEKFIPPTGTKLDIFCTWGDAKGKSHRVPAQSWVRSVTRRYYLEKLDGGLPEGMKPIPANSELRFDDKHDELMWFARMSEKERDALLALSKDEKYRKAITSIFERSQIHPMKADFVFAGSGWFVDEDGSKFFQAESGDVICVANFASALVDVAQQSSSQGEANLLYEAWAERVPPLGTTVTLEITVAKPAKPEKGERKDGEKP